MKQTAEQATRYRLEQICRTTTEPKTAKLARDALKCLASISSDVQEPLETATSAMATISAAIGRASLVQENPDLDGFTVDEELDEISAQVGVLRESLAFLSAAMKGD